MLTDRLKARGHTIGAALLCAIVLPLAAAAPPPKQGAGTAPKDPPPPPAQATAPLAIDAKLGAEYGALIDQLPKPDRRGSAPWFGLSLDSKGLVADKHFTDATVAELTKSLASLQPSVEKVMELAARPVTIPKNAADDPKATSEAIKQSMADYNNMRSAARLLTSDACRLFMAGKRQDSAKRIAACIGIARQLANGSELHGLVSAAIVLDQGRHLETMNKGVGGKKLDAEMKSIIRAEFEKLDPALPFGCPMPASRAATIKLDMSSMKTLLAP
jgi:hypothetical protein